VTMQGLVIVAGLGEIGNPLLQILSRTFPCTGIDVDPVQIEEPCSVLHICYPFQIAGFSRVTAQYIHRLHPKLTIIHATVPPGTTRDIQTAVAGSLVAYSPVRGKHAVMQEAMLRYVKFVAAPKPAATWEALAHLRQAGFQTATMATPEIAELAKLLETTYLGVLVAWTQEMERLAVQYGGTFSEVNRFVEEVSYLPAHIFPGVIGGHCVLPNIDLLRSRVNSRFLDLVVDSNDLKRQLQPTALREEIHDEDRIDRVGVLGA
jgi:UDP-N-acetyl-D-mannosaminuronate dehydrogenase